MSPDLLAEPELRTAIDRTASAYSEAMTVGLRDATMPAEMTRRMQEDIYIFSGFKTYHSLKEASLLLRDEQGLIKPFDRFYKDVAAIDAAYNKNYLQAEYIFATQSARMAAKWADFEQNGDRYDLQYRTAGDDKVREAHAALDLVTLPSTDPFWEEYFPPNGWRCRCNAVEVRKGKYPRSNPDTALIAGREATSGKEAIFRFNPGKQACIFPKHHPYYGRRGYAHCSTPNLAGSRDGFDPCPVLAELLQGKYDDEGYAQIKTKRGKLLCHRDADKTELEDNIRTGTVLAETFPDLDIRIREHVRAHGHKNPEYEIDGKLADAKRVLSPKGITAGFVAAIKQGSKIVIIDYDKHLNGQFVKRKETAHNIARRDADFRRGDITGVYVIHNENAVYIPADTASDWKWIEEKLKERGM